MSTRVLLLRHGATDVMLTHLAGRTAGIPLNAAGRAQADALAQRIGPVAAIYTSPIDRAMETAAAMALQQRQTPITIDGFAEFDFGEWTGASFESLPNDPRWLEFNHARECMRAPGGESMSEVQQRALDALRSLVRKHDRQRIAIISHGDVIRALLIYVSGTTIRNYWRFTVDAASITELAWGSEGDERIIRMNDCAHLEHLAS